MNENTKILIPQVFHRISIGSTPASAEFEAFGKTWLDMNPGWKMRVWTEADLPELAHVEEFERAVTPTQISNLMRWCIIAKFGGIFIDNDMECLKPIEPILENVSCFVAMKKNSTYPMASIFGATKGHLLAIALENNLHTNDPLLAYDHPCQYLNEQLKANPEGVTIFEAIKFFPLNRNELPPDPLEYPGSYGICHWSSGTYDDLNFKTSYLDLSEDEKTEVDNASGEILEKAIPKVLHRIWVGPNPMPPEFEAWGKTWLDLNPGWTMRTWTDADIPELGQEHVEEIKRAANRAQISNIMRWAIVAKYGGIYIDTDFEGLKPIDPILAGVECFVAMRKNSSYPMSSIFGARKGHPLAVALDENTHTKDPSLKFEHGYRYLDEQLKAHPNGVTVFEAIKFCPIDKNEVKLPAREYPGSYGIHHWSSVTRPDLGFERLPGADPANALDSNALDKPANQPPPVPSDAAERARLALDRLKATNKATGALRGTVDETIPIKVRRDKD